MYNVYYIDNLIRIILLYYYLFVSLTLIMILFLNVKTFIIVINNNDAPVNRVVTYTYDTILLYIIKF